MRRPSNPAHATRRPMSLAGLAQGAGVHLAARVAAMTLALALMVAVARLGPAVQGAFALLLAVESVLLTLCSGFGLALARRVSHHGDDPAAPLRAWLGVALAAGGAAAIALWTLGRIAPRAPYDMLVWLAPAAPLLLLAPTASGLWLGRAQMARLAAPQVALPLVALVALALITVWRGDAAGLRDVLLAWVASRVLVALGTAAWALRDAPPVRPAPRLHLRGDLGFVVAVGAANVVGVLNYRVPLFVVERSAGIDATGVYAVAVQVAELPWLLSAALSTAAYRRIGERDAARAARTALAAARWGVAAALAAAPLLALAAWALLPPLLGAAYAGAWWPLVLLLPGVVLYAAASALSAYFTNHLGRPQWPAWIAALSLALNTLACLWAVPRHGLAGAALSTSASYALAIGFALALFLRATGLPLRALWRRPDPQSAP